ASPRVAKAACSFQPQSPVGIAGLTPRQAVDLTGRLRGGRRVAVRNRAEELFAALELSEWVDKPLRSASGGVARLVLFCAAAVVPGRLVILDEPTNDVDPRRRRRLWELVRGLADAGSAVVLVTHSVLEAERAVDRLAIINAGKVVAQGSPAAVRGDQGWLRLELTLEEPFTASFPAFVADPVATGRRLSGRLAEADLPAALGWAQALRSSGLAEAFSIGPTSLEDAYERLVPATGDQTA
ncbi:MAG: AAA family ATPase, partial [Mycobacteriales bacterium]